MSEDRKRQLVMSPLVAGDFKDSEEVDEFLRPIHEFVAKIGPMNRPGAQVYFSDNLLAFGRNLSFFDDSRFLLAVANQAADVTDTGILWRTHMLCWAARSAAMLEGDFVECGTYRGYSAAVVAECLSFEEMARRFYLYDTFEAPAGDQANPTLSGHRGGLYDEVARRFADYPNVDPVRGRLPGVLATASPERVAFLHMDLNDAAAELATLEELFPRMVPGAIAIFDDYGWAGFRATRDALRQFAEARAHPIAELPTGQGLLIRR